MDFLIGIILAIPIVVISLTLHEFAHAFVATKLGDPTPRNQGRLTIDPRSHFDILGLVFGVLSHYGWSKPTEINPKNFKHFRRDQIIFNLSGPVMNFLIGILFITIYTITHNYFSESSLMSSTFFIYIMNYVQMALGLFALININLFVFNLLPIPPLDGYNIASMFFERKYYDFFSKLNQYGMIIIVLLLFTERFFLSPLVIPADYIANYIASIFVNLVS